MLSLTVGNGDECLYRRENTDSANGLWTVASDTGPRPIVRLITISVVASKCVGHRNLSKVYTVEPVYNDIGLCDTSSITSDILWYQLIHHY